jgi:hypothetical protein
MKASQPNVSDSDELFARIIRGGCAASAPQRANCPQAAERNIPYALGCHHLSNSATLLPFI